MTLRIPQTALAALTSLGLLSCNGPMGLLPGGQLEGETRATPTDWSFAGDAGTAQLETQGEEPYSVNLAYTILGGHVYVNAGGTETRWVQNMERDPLVRLRIDDGIYDLRAQRVVDGDEITAFAEAWTSQSFFRRDPLKYDEVWIYRLVQR